MLRKEIHSDLPIPPGEYLAEIIADLGITETELAQRINEPLSEVRALLMGNKTITPLIALYLERAVDVSQHIWLELETEYRATLAYNSSSAM